MPLEPAFKSGFVSAFKRTWEWKCPGPLLRDVSSPRADCLATRFGLERTGTVSYTSCSRINCDGTIIPFQKLRCAKCRAKHSAALHEMVRE